MQTAFSSSQLEQRRISESNKILRSCVHCGMCTATCPTYLELGDELDSPRGRIYLIKDMLENERVPNAKTVAHIDRCLSCLSCMTTCPSGVHYMHLIDHAREYIEESYKRSLDDRFIRWVLRQVLPYPSRFRLAMLAAKLARPFRALVPDARLRAMLEMAPRRIPPPSAIDAPQVFRAEGGQVARVALMTGCAQRALHTGINEATVRLLKRHGCEVVVAVGAGCCGALTHHMGKSEISRNFASRNINAWHKELRGDGLDAVIINASGCGTTVKDYGHMFKEHPLERKAEEIASITRDISEFMLELGLKNAVSADPLKIAYHSACSLQHGQRVKAAPVSLLRTSGFRVVEPAEQHLCCGSAGTYNLLQPDISNDLKFRKVKNIEQTKPDAVAAGNIGCMVQISSGTRVPVVHTVELLDWATGGPVPPAISASAGVSGQVSSARPQR